MFRRLICIAAIACVTVSLQSCDEGDDGPSPSKDVKEYLEGRWKPYSYKLRPTDNDILISTCESIQHTVDQTSHVVTLRLLFDFDPGGTAKYSSICPDLSPGTLQWEIYNENQLLLAETGMAYTIESASDVEIKLAGAKGVSESLKIYITMRRY
jgi:hypothetical protein